MINVNEVVARKKELEYVLETLNSGQKDEIELIIKSRIKAYDSLLISDYIEKIKSRADAYPAETSENDK